MATTMFTSASGLAPAQPHQGYARLAGGMYLLVMLSFMLGLLMATQFIVPGDLAASARKVVAAERLYRITLVSPLVGSVGTILLGGAFFALLRPLDVNLALFALLWRVAEATLGGVLVILQFMALENLLVQAAGGPGASGQHELAQLLLSTGYRACFHISIIYFAMGSVIFFALLYRSHWIPRPLCVLGMLASVMASALGFAYLIAPRVAFELGLAGWAPIFVAEITTGLWLLIKGADSAQGGRGGAAAAAAL